MPPKRRDPAAEAEAATQESKRFKKVIDESAEDFLCPITLALPLDPVTAEDGMTYERSAIADWIAKGNGKSPKTNEPMGRRLFPATHVKSMIERLVKSGALTGDKAEAWQKRLADEEEVRKWRVWAEAGDTSAMYMMGLFHIAASHGVKKDEAAAIRWFQRAADAGHAEALFELGDCYCRGVGVGKNASLGFVHITQAAMMGSKYGAEWLHEAFRDGERDLPKDPKQSEFWKNFGRNFVCAKKN